MRVFYVTFSNDCHDVIVVEVQAPTVHHAEEAVLQSYGSWVDTVVFESPPLNEECISLETLEACFSVDSE